MVYKNYANTSKDYFCRGGCCFIERDEAVYFLSVCEHILLLNNEIDMNAYFYCFALRLSMVMSSNENLMFKCTETKISKVEKNYRLEMSLPRLYSFGKLTTENHLSNGLDYQLVLKC